MLHLMLHLEHNVLFTKMWFNNIVLLAWVTEQFSDWPNCRLSLGRENLWTGKVADSKIGKKNRIYRDYLQKFRRVKHRLQIVQSTS